MVCPTHMPDLQAASEWLYIVPWGIGKTLVWLTERYQKPLIFVTENGEPQLLQFLEGYQSFVSVLLGSKAAEIDCFEQSLFIQS